VQEGSDTSASNIQLCVQEILSLQTQRASLQSLDRLDVPFRILRHLAVVESSLPLNNMVLPEIQLLRKELAGAEWFKELCLAHVDDVYRRFMNAGKENSNNVSRKMVEMFQLIVADGTSGIMCI